MDAATAARAHLAEQLRGIWTGSVLQTPRGDAHVRFGGDVDQLTLIELDVFTHGHGVGGGVMEALKAFCDRAQVSLIALPTSSSEHLSPFRHPWLRADGHRDGVATLRYDPPSAGRPIA